MEQRAKTRDLLDRATDDRDPVSAWQKVQQAEATDPFYARIGDVKKHLLPRLRRRLESQLREAEGRLKAGKIDQAEADAREVRDVVGTEPDLKDLAARADSVVERCIEDGKLLKTLAEESDRVRDLMDTDLAAAELAIKRLWDLVEGREVHFTTPVQNLDLALQSKRGLAQFVQTIERQIREAEEDAALEHLQEALDNEERLRGRTPQLEALAKKLIARRAFLDGRRALALGLYERACNAFRRVIDLGGEDATEAQRQIAEAQATAQDELGAQDALERATDLLHDGRFSEALDIVERWVDKRTTKQANLRRLEKEIRSTWENSTVTELNDLIAQMDEKPLLSRIERLITEVLGERLKSPHAARYRDQVLPDLYRRLALGWEKSGTVGDLQKALEYLDKALECATDTSALGQDRRRVHKKIILAEWKREHGQGKMGEACQYLIEQVSKHNYYDDVELMYLIAEDLISLEEFQSADQYLRFAEQALERSKNVQYVQLPESQIVQKVKDLRVSWSQNKEIYETLAHVGELSRTDKGVSDYKRARDLVSDLKNKYPDRSTEIDRRWRELAKGTRASLAKELKKLSGRSRLEWRDKLRDALTKGVDETIKQRWLLATRMLALMPQDVAALPVREEWDAALVQLQSAVRVQQDELYSGPPDMTPDQAVDAQIERLQYLREWALLLYRCLDECALAKGADASPQSGVESDRTVVRELINRIDDLLPRLQTLRQSLGQVSILADRAVSAWRQPNRNWSHVKWNEVVRALLSVEATGKLWSLAPEDSAEWEQICGVLASNRFSRRLDEVPWTQIDRIVEAAGIYEKWNEVDEHMGAIAMEFRNHRAVVEQQRRIAELKSQRKRLVVLVAELWAFMQGEYFQDAQTVIDEIEKLLDEKDTFGLRMLMAFPDPYMGMSLQLYHGDLYQQVQQRYEQWRIIEEWLSPIRASMDWDRVQPEVHRRIDAGNFEEARDILRDVLNGRDEKTGKRNLLKRLFPDGGELSLMRMKSDLAVPPPAAAEHPTSLRVKKLLDEQARLSHDVDEAIRKADEMLKRVDELESKRKGYVELLESWMGQIQRPRLKRKDREGFLQNCRSLVDRAKMEGICPNWDGWDQWLQKIKQAV